jgi:HK97 family phage prohead protease
MQAQPDEVHRPDRDDADELERRTIRPDSSADVEIEQSDDEPTEITVPVSSTTPHRSHGVMTDPALETMREQLEAGTVGLWDDHGLADTGFPEYRREDMYGYWVDGEIEDGVLYGTARLREGDPRSADLVDQLKQDLPIGFSVGYIALKDEWVEREDGERREIVDVDLLETSPVGIPDNPDAVAEEAPARLIARSVADADLNLDLDRTTASAIGDAVAETLETMTDDSDDSETDGSDEDVANAGDDSEQTENDVGADADQRQFTDDEIEEILGIVGGAMEAHLQEALEDISEELAADDEGDEDGEDEGSEEEAGGDHDDDDDEEMAARVAELERRLDEKEAEIQEQQATIERLESETRESADRKGITPASADAAEDNDAADSTDRSASEPSNLLEEGYELQ